MTIPMKKYVDIVSGVGGVAQVATRELIGRFFTNNPLLPVDTQVEFTSADEVCKYFNNTNGEECNIATWYFSFISKQITRPRKISFARWPDVDVAPYLIGVKSSKTLAQWVAVTDGSFNLDIGGVAHFISGIDFTAATSLTDVASIIQAAINAQVGAQFTGATVTWGAAGDGLFQITGGATGINNARINIDIYGSNIGTDISQIGWLSMWNQGNNSDTNNLGRVSAGIGAQTPAQTFEHSALDNNNFGSFAFLDQSLTAEQIVDVATINYSYNNMFLYSVGVDVSQLSALSPLLYDLIGGIALSLNSPIQYSYNDFVVYHGGYGSWPQYLPMAILASTAWNRQDASQNYMFQQATLPATVSDEAESNALDGGGINYYGSTQQAGRKISFYQRGKLQGQFAKDPIDMNVYVNEIWLKDVVAVQLMNLLLALGKISANRQGRATVIAGVQSVVALGLNNGVISIGKRLNTTQKTFISTFTGSPDAWREVESGGYWLDCEIVEVPTNSGIEYVAQYRLVYSKDDAIRKIEGSHVLI